MWICGYVDINGVKTVIWCIELLPHILPLLLILRFIEVFRGRIKRKIYKGEMICGSSTILQMVVFTPFMRFIKFIKLMWLERSEIIIIIYGLYGRIYGVYTQYGKKLYYILPIQCYYTVEIIWLIYSVYICMFWIDLKTKISKWTLVIYFKFICFIYILILEAKR